MPLMHWRKYGMHTPGNPKTMAFIEKVFIDVEANGEAAVLNKKYMKATYTAICLSDKQAEQTFNP